MQQAILQKFRSGEHNILVATSIGEEGLDIMEVDLVICFDANISPLRMIQRMGRTGRKHKGRVVVLACEGQELKGYLKKQGNARTMKRLLRNRDSFEYHASPRMVPHVYKPEVKYVKLSIEKYISCSKKIKVDVKGASPILNNISEEDGQLIARYFGACKEDIWRPALVAFPSFQVSPCDVYKVPHSSRTTDMLIDAMQQLQDLSFSRTKCRNPLQESVDVPAVKDQVLEGLYVNATKEAIPQEYCGSGTEASSGEVAWSKSVCVPSSPAEKYPAHSFFSGDYVTVDVRGYVSITFVPALPKTSELHKDIRNVNWQHKVQNKTTPYKLSADATGPTVEFYCHADAPYSSKPIFADSVLNLAPHSPEYVEQCNHADDIHVLGTPPSKILTTPREWDTPCNAKLASPALSGQEDMELSPRLTHYIEEGIVPESPVLEVSHQQLETDSDANVSFSPKVGSSKSHGQGAQANGPGCQNIPLSYKKKGRFLAGITELAGSSRANVLDQTQAKTEEPMCPSNAKIYSPAAHIPTANLLCDSLSDDWQLKSVGDTSGSVQQASKYRRLCKYGDKIKRVSSMSLDDRYDGFVGGQCALATKSMPNEMGDAIGNKVKAKRRLVTYIDEEVKVSEDADISADEEDDQSQDKYEDSFIDDQTTPTGQFTQSGQGGENTGGMMAFYRRSLLTQSPVVLPSRYQDVSDNSGSRAGSASCSSENFHNSVQTPQGIPRTHRTMDPSPLGHQQSSLVRVLFAGLLLLVIARSLLS